MLKMPNGKEIDEEEVKDAFQNASEEAAYYLNLETGKVIFVSRIDNFYEGQEEDEEDEEDEETEPPNFNDRNLYIPIEKIPSYKAYQWMEDFVAEIVEPTNKPIAEKLEIALMGKGAFRRFKDVLRMTDDELLKAWYRWEDKQFNEAVKEWFKELSEEL